MIPGKHQDFTPPKLAAPSNAWLVTFADLVSLLITFFVMMYAMKAADMGRWEDVRGAFAGALKVSQTDDTNKKDRSIERVQIVQSDNLDYIQNLLRQRFDDDTLLRRATLTRNDADNTLSINLPADVLFASGNTQFVGEARASLIVVADLLRNLHNPIMVIGHSDPNPIQSRSYPTNWELSMMRALSVRNLLRESGVAGPIRVQGMADSRFSDIPEGLPNTMRYQQARRVEIKLSGHRNAFSKEEGGR